MLRAELVCALVLAGCGATVSETFTNVGDELPTSAAATLEPTPIPTPTTAICDAFDIVNDVISPAWSAVAEGVTDIDQLASTIEAAAASIEDLAETEPNPEVAQQIAGMAERYRDEAGAVRQGELAGTDATDFYLDLVVEHADMGTCP